MKRPLYYIVLLAIGVIILNACNEDTEAPAATQQAPTFDIHLQANNCEGEPLSNGFMLVTDARNIQYAYKMDESGTVLADYPADPHLLFPLTYTLYDDVFGKSKEETELPTGADEQFMAIGETVCDNFDGDYLQVSFGKEHFVFDDLYIDILAHSSGDDLRIHFSNWVSTPPVGLENQQQNGGLGIRELDGIGTYPMRVPDVNGNDSESFSQVGFFYVAGAEEGPSFERAYGSPMSGLNDTPDAALELTKIPDSSGPDFRGYFSGEAGLSETVDFVSNTYESTTMTGSFRATPQ